MVSRSCKLFVLAIWFVLGVAAPASAEKRAFVVGTDRYTTLASLKTAVADGTAITRTLGEVGFKVSFVKDPTLSEFDAAWAEFVGALKPGDDVAFYFGGHGIQVEGANYLLPRNAPGLDAGQAGVLERSIDFTQVIEAMQARQPRVAIVILDACRNDPFRDKGKGQAKNKWLQAKGLARLDDLQHLRDVLGRRQRRGHGRGRPQPHELGLCPSFAAAARQGRAEHGRHRKRVQVVVADETRKFQNPAYFDGIIGQYFLALSSDAAGQAKPSDSIVSPSVVRLGGFATWDANCQSRPAPRIQVSAPPKLGRVMLRYEGFNAAGNHFGNACAKSKQRGVGVYYVVDDANRDSTAVDRVRFSVKHWSVAPATSVEEVFEVDLATRYSKRVTGRQ